MRTQSLNANIFPLALCSGDGIFRQHMENYMQSRKYYFLNGIQVEYYTFSKIFTENNFNLSIMGNSKYLHSCNISPVSQRIYSHKAFYYFLMCVFLACYINYIQM